MIAKPWLERIEDAKQRKVFGIFPSFTIRDRLDAIDFKRCAVEEMEKRFGVNRVEDGVLMQLGSEFGGAVLFNRVKKAARILEAIENRTIEIDLRRATANTPRIERPSKKIPELIPA